MKIKSGAEAVSPEILLEIFGSLKNQSDIFNCCLVLRSWHGAGVEKLYQCPVVKGEKSYRAFVVTMCLSEQRSESPFSKHIESLDLSGWPDEADESTMTNLLAMVHGRLVIFIAPHLTFSVNSLGALSKCRQLIRLDMSRILSSFRAPDFSNAVSQLSCLKVFHFPGCPSASPDSSGNDNERTELAPTWSNSLETFHMTPYLHTSYDPFCEKAPASVTNIIIHNDVDMTTTFLDRVFGLLGPRIVNLSLECRVGHWGQLSDVLVIFPNLLRLSIRPCFITRDALDGMGQKHPLQLLTISFETLWVLCQQDFMACLKQLLYHDCLYNIRSLLLSDKLAGGRWESFLQDFSPQLAWRFSDISDCLRQRNNASAGLIENGVWILARGDDNYDTICEFTEENLEEIIENHKELRSVGESIIELEEGMKLLAI